MPQLYVIYRPEDTRKKSQEIIDVLQKTYGATNINTPDYDGYVDVYQIEQDVQKSHYLLVVIGNYWADLVDESGQNLLASVYDPVHMAISTAINARKRIVPILVDGAKMPSRARLPRELRPLTAQEPVKLDKNAVISKSLNKGLKDIIKRETMLKMPELPSVKNVSQRLSNRHPSQAQQPRFRQPGTNQPDWRTLLHRLQLPIVLILCVIIVVVVYLTTVPSQSSIQVADEDSITPVLATIEPTATSTNSNDTDSNLTESPPQVATPVYAPITVDNAQDVIRIDSGMFSISSAEQFLFSSDESLFIFASPDLQEVQVIDVATNLVIGMLDISPYEPLIVELNEDETLLHILTSNGEVQLWGVPTD